MQNMMRKEFIMINYYKFDIMWKDELCTTVELDKTNDITSIQRYAQKPPKQQLYCEQNRESIYDFICSRCFEESRADKHELLNKLNITSYNPWDIVKVTHGRLYDYYCWIRFDGENLAWKDVAYDRINYTR